MCPTRGYIYQNKGTPRRVGKCSGPYQKITTMAKKECLMDLGGGYIGQVQG